MPNLVSNFKPRTKTGTKTVSALFVFRKLRQWTKGKKKALSFVKQILHPTLELYIYIYK